MSTGAFREALNRRWELVLGILLLVYFAARLIFLAVWLDHTVPPDETTHFGRVQAYATTLGIPEDSPSTYEFGLVTRIPYFYYWVMAKLQWANVLPVPDLLFLRLANVALSVLMVVYGWRWIRLLTRSRITQVLFLVVMTNTPALTGIGGSVSYDNLTNLLGAMAMYYLFAFFEARSPERLAKFLLATLAGCLTKITFLPLAFILVVILLVHERRALLDAPRRLLASLMPARPKRLALYALVVVFAALNVGLYGVNRLRYGSLVPGSQRVIGLENALQNRIFARNYVVNQFRKGAISYDEAVAMALEIKQPGNRRRALSLLAVARHPPEARRASVWGRDVYVGIWTHIMLLRVTGFDGHRVMLKSVTELLPLYAMLAVAGVMFARTIRWRYARGYPLYAAVAILFYVLVLMWQVNYPRYVASAVPDLDVRGRYLFPLWVPICGLFVYYLQHFFPRRVRILLAAAVAVYFLLGDFPYFLFHVTPCWFKGTADWPECLATLG